MFSALSLMDCASHSSLYNGNKIYIMLQNRATKENARHVKQDNKQGET